MNELLLRRRIAIINSTPSLPYDAEVEYLQSNGNQYINLPYGFDDTDEIVIVAALGDSFNDRYLLAPNVWNDNSNRFAMCGTYQSRFTVGYGTSSTNQTYLTPSTNIDYNMHTWKYSNHLFEITDLNISKDVSSFNFGAETAYLKLFFGYNASTRGKIKSFTHKKNGATVLNMISVRVGTIGYMYDKVSGTLYGNDGAGAVNFTLGNDIT